MDAYWARSIVTYEEIYCRPLIYRGASEARRNCVTQTEATALEQNNQLEMRSDTAQSERKEVPEMRSDNAAPQLATAQSERKEVPEMRSDNAAPQLATAQSERKEVPVKA